MFKGLANSFDGPEDNGYALDVIDSLKTNQKDQVV